MEFIRANVQEKPQTLEGGVTAAFPKQKSSLYDEYEAITSEDCSFQCDHISVQRADARIDPASLEMFDGKSHREAHLVGTPCPESRKGFMGVPLFTKTEIDVMESTHYQGTLSNTFQGRVVQNAAFFVLNGVASILDAKFIQLHVHGPFVSCHSGPDSKRVSETHYLSNKIVATVLVGSILHLPRSLNASLCGKPMLDGAIITTDMDGCDIHFLVSGLGGKRKKKTQLVGRGDYTSEAVRAVVKGVVRESAGVAAGIAGRAALEAAMYVAKKGEAATRSSRVAAGKKIAKFVKSKMSYLGSHMSRLVGKGSYTIAGDSTVVNSLMKGSNMSAYSSFGGDHASCIIEHREFIGDIATGTIAAGNFPFSIGVIELNPGLIASFPWLAQIAANYEEWCALGLVMEFVSTTSPYNSESAMGELIFTSQDNAVAPPYTTRSQLFNSEMSVAARLDKNLMYGIECKNPAVPWYMVRSSATSTPINLCDPAKFYYSTAVASTFPQNSTIGQLWVTYRIALRGPILKSAAGGTIVGVFNTAELGTTAVPGFFGSLNGTVGTIKGYGRFASQSTVQKTFTNSSTSTTKGYVNIPSPGVGDIYKVTFTWTVSLFVASTLPLVNVYFPTSSVTGLVSYVPDSVCGLLSTPANGYQVPNNGISLNLRTYVQSSYWQVTSTGFSNNKAQLQFSWPIVAGNSVNNGVYPVCNVVPTSTFGGNSSLVAEVTYFGTQAPATFGSSTNPNQSAVFFSSTPLWGNDQGVPTAVGQYESPTLLP